MFMFHIFLYLCVYIDKVYTNISLFLLHTVFNHRKIKVTFNRVYTTQPRWGILF